MLINWVFYFLLVNMKNWKKILLGILLIIFLVFVVWVLLFISWEKKVTKYSTLCMDKVRAEFWGDLESVVFPYAEKVNGEYIYSWNVRYQWTKYNFYCSVIDKDNIDLKLEEVDDNKQWIDNIIKDYNWVILRWSDLRPNTATNNDNINIKNGRWWYTTIIVNLTGGTIYIDYDYNFALKINGDGINIKTLELSYNDYSKLTSLTIKWENWNHVYYTHIYPWKDYLSECKSSNDLERNFKIWGGNEKYIFVIRSVDERNISLRMKLFTDTDSLEKLVERKHCDCKSCRVVSYDF